MTVNNRAIVSVELALLLPLIAVLFMAGIYSAVNSMAFYKVTAANCLAMEETLAAMPPADPPWPTISCAAAPNLMEWPF